MFDILTKKMKFYNTNMKFKDFIGSKFYYSVARSHKQKYNSKLFLT